MWTGLTQNVVEGTVFDFWNLAVGNFAAFSFYLVSFSFGDSSSNLKKPYGEAHVLRNQGLHQQLAHTRQPREWAVLELTPPVPVRPWSATAPANILIATLGEAPSQNHIAKLVSNNKSLFLSH